ncbi:MAG: Cna B-type domain-containing protein [Bilifractor sp.]
METPGENKPHVGIGKCFNAGILAFLCCILLVFSGMPVAAENTDSDSIRLTSDCEGASFTLYQVAERQSDGTFVLTKDFSASGTDVNDLTTDGLQTLGTTLSAYIAEKKPAEISTQKIQSGTCQWTGLQDGLYLAVGSPVRQKGKLTEFSPVVSYLPYTEDGNQVRDLHVEVKSAEVPWTTQFRVDKVWQDGNYSKRPDHVQVSLIQQDDSVSRVYDTQTLSKDNGWRYIWKNLPDGYAYRAVETDVPSGYTQKVFLKTSRNGTGRAAITNSRPYESKKTGTDTNQTTSGKLPQTGQLWWPVPVLILGGLICLLAALWKKNRAEK